MLSLSCGYQVQINFQIQTLNILIHRVGDQGMPGYLYNNKSPKTELLRFRAITDETDNTCCLDGGVLDCDSEKI